MYYSSYLARYCEVQDSKYIQQTERKGRRKRKRNGRGGRGREMGKGDDGW